MGPVRFFHLFGLIDLLSGFLLFFTSSPIPVAIAQAHAGFLIYKGMGSHIQYIPMPMPVLYMGIFADLMSAAILFVGTPPIMEGYSIYLAAALLFKGLISSTALMT